jgi:hypothetical protein
MADGTHKPIEQINAGDTVLATNPETGETGPRTVRIPISGKGIKNLVEITIDTDGPTGNQTGTLTATDNHPFWSPKLHTWIPASELRAGNSLQTSVESKVEVTNVLTRNAWRRVYNLSVNGLHTYYVLAGSAPVLTHNDSADEREHDTSRQARLDAMRQAGLPTSLQPTNAKYYSGGYGQGGGYQDVYEYNGRTWLVTDNWNDLNADTKHGPHWEVGEAKPDGQRDSLGRLRVSSSKTKANYGGGCG